MALKLLAANNAQTVLSAGISSSATTLTVNTGAGALFPAPVSGTSFYKLTLVDAATGQLTEIMHVTERTGDVMTVLRAQEGTTARSWSANDIVANMLTAGTLSYLFTNFQPLDDTLTALSSLTGAADKLAYFNGIDTAALTALTSVGRDIIGQTSIANILSYLTLGTAATKNVGTGANNIPDMSSFASGTGWTRLPNGKILQWGSYSNPGSVFSGTVNFPIPFVSSPGRVLMTSFHTTIDSNPIVLAQDTSNLSLTSFSWRLSTTSPARSFNWLSIGE
ncbi:gp53-like domain-containing protein [Enterobacter soli]|uniref:gp53-like domain-containing protein n=1 Tax=Enterobacter soli TaxID=885040 RepID=UPI00402AA45D